MKLNLVLLRLQKGYVFNRVMNKAGEDFSIMMLQGHTDVSEKKAAFEKGGGLQRPVQEAKRTNEEFDEAVPNSQLKKAKVTTGTLESESFTKETQIGTQEESSLQVGSSSILCTDNSSENALSTDVKQMHVVEKCNERSASDTLTSSAPKLAHRSAVNIEADAAEDKGSRHTMEDAWTVLMDASMGKRGKLRCSYFAIFDGHAGRQAAEYARAHLHENVLSAGLPLELMDIKTTKKAIIEGFKRTDESLLQESMKGGWQDGATAVSVWVLGNTAFIANIGDAKVVLGRLNINSTGDNQAENNRLKGVTVTREHKAIFPTERARIQKAGGYVAENGRLLGRLEVSRAFGDRQFKKVGVTAVPDVHSFEITERERFLILGCDGLWGVFGPDDAVEFVDAQLKAGVSVGVACRRLVREAIRERRCKDNCTALLVSFKHSGDSSQKPK